MRHIDYMNIALKPFTYDDGAMQLYAELRVVEDGKPTQHNYIVTIPADLLESEFDYFFNIAREALWRRLRATKE